MKSSSSMRQVTHSNLFIPTSEMFEIGGRVLSLPSLEIHETFNQENQQCDHSKKHHTSMDDVNNEGCDQHPISCLVDSTVILGAKTSCGYITSSYSSSSTSISISDTLHLVQRLTSVYDNQDSQSLLDSDLLSSEYDNNDLLHFAEALPGGEISLHVPNFQSDIIESIEDITMRSTPVDRTEDDNSTSSSLSPSHKLGVPSKAAAILGAREMFTSPSHAAYRRLVDYTHRPACDGSSLLNTDAPYPPSAIHPSLTARPHRKSKPDMKPFETSPEKKVPSKYKIINIGIDDVKEKLNFLRKPGELLTPSSNSESYSTKSTKTKDADKLIKSGGASLMQIRKWSNSFEELLHDKYGLALFHEYLKSEYSEENIEFWIACEEYRAIGNPKKMAVRAHKIIKDFVATQASKEINLDSKTRQLTLENIHHPNSKMFEMAQKRIQTLMEIDSYQRFLRSGMYQSLLQDITNASISTENPRSPPASVLIDYTIKTMGVSNSATSSIDIPDSDSIHSLRDIRSPDSIRQFNQQNCHTSIIRISSVKTPRNDNNKEPGIPPSSSENCLKNTTR